MATITTDDVPVATAKQTFPWGFAFDFLLLIADFALGWTWARILPLNGAPGQAFWPGLWPLFGGAALLYILGLWLYKKPLAALGPESLRRARFKVAVKKATLPILVMSVDGRKVRRLSHDLFAVIAFNAILLVALVGAVYSLVSGGLNLTNILGAAAAVVGIAAVGVTLVIVFFSVGQGATEPGAGRSSVVPAALLQLPFLLCLMGVVSAIAGNTVPPPMDHPTVLETVLQIPLFAALFCFLSYTLLFTPRKLLGLPLRGPLPAWLFWLLLLISYGVRLGLERYAR